MLFQGISNPGIEPRSPMLQTDSLTSESPGKTICFEMKQLKIIAVWVLFKSQVQGSIQPFFTILLTQTLDHFR